MRAYWRSVTAKWFHGRASADELEEELRLHIEHRADDLEREGLSRAEAERRARIEFGAFEKFREESHAARGGNFLETALQDLRFSLRVLRKARGFALTAAVTLALAIGANAVVFGLMDALILRPLNVPDAKSLWGMENGDGSGYQSYPNYLDFRERNRSFDDLAAIRMTGGALDTGRDDPATVSGWETSGNYFDVLRLQPYLGRFYHGRDEYGPNSAPWLVLSYAYWHSRFHDDAGVVGRVVQLNRHPFTIVGVAPPEFRGTLLFIAPDIFMPLVNQAQVDGEDVLNVRTINNRSLFELLGHLKPGVTRAQAIRDLDAIGASLEKTWPKEVAHRNFSLERPGLYVFGSPARAFMAGLMLLAGMILLAACANLGSLFAARAVDRSREVALRLALGSSRYRILRQLLTEALLVALAGGAAGVAGSVYILRRLSLWQPFPGVGLRIPVTPDASIYVVALALAVASGALFGLVPVLQVFRANPWEVVKAGSGGRPRGKFRRLTGRDLLMVFEIAICAVLVTSSLVAVRGLVRSLHSKLGFEPRNTMVAGTSLNMAGYSGDQVTAMQKRMIAAMASIPGVERVGLVNNYPPLVYTAANRTNVFREETKDLRQANIAERPFRFEVSPDYFAAAGTALVAGRDISWHDDGRSPAVAVVNQEFARRIFRSIDKAMGGYFRLQDGRRVQVVGVVEDGKYFDLTEDHQPAVFLSFLQWPASGSYVILRSKRDSQQLAAAMRSQLRGLDAGLVADVRTWSSMLEVVLFPARVATMALGILGMMGAMLSVTGIFGMAAYSVSRRLRELGIRMALGAQRSEVLQAALGRAVRLLLIGSAAGLVLGILASRVLASIVYGATPRDPLVLTGVVVAMGLLGVLATWIPAQRALSLDPMMLLREE